jgi:hypothetical protein
MVQLPINFDFLLLLRRTRSILIRARPNTLSTSSLSSELVVDVKWEDCVEFEAEIVF